jgi:ribosomal peptide maturation radical SAM protein 1
MPNMKTPSILFLQMPWATGQRPSIALGILSELCREKSVPVQTFYPNLDMAAVVGFETAGRMSNERLIYGVSEHIFAVDIFGREALGSEDYLDAVANTMRRDSAVHGWKSKFADVAYLRYLRDDAVPRFLDAVERRVMDVAPDVIGFTATFNQVMSSLALAARLKKRRPEIQIIAGGACFDDEMGIEYHRALPHIINHVFLGEAEESFREYLSRIKVGAATDAIPGVTYVQGGEVHVTRGHHLKDMNQSPSPDYDAFFAEKERMERETGLVFNIEYLPFESSRGCWWGEKNQCTFCGINPDLMGFRAKDIDTVIRDIVTLSMRYGVVKFTATDWIISRWHCDELFRRLKELDLDLEIFYEVRADMKKAQLKAMKEAGVVTVQPGIESLSTPLLQLMKKGTTSLRHIQFIRWCKELGIDLSYNILAGFPDEKEEWYYDMARLIPKLGHLQPPLNNVTLIEMHRFAPLYENRDALGVDQIAIRPDYGFNIPMTVADPLRFAYFFHFHSNRIIEGNDHLKAVETALQPWIDAHAQKKLATYEYTIGAGFLRITDTRFGEGRYLHLREIYQDIVLLCDAVQGRKALLEDLSKMYPREVKDGTAERVIQELIDADILLAEGNFLVTLPIGKRFRATEELRSYVLGKEQPEPQPPPPDRKPAALLPVLA